VVGTPNSTNKEILDLEQSNPFGDLRLNKLSPLSLPVSMLKRFVWHGFPVFKLGAKTGQTNGRMFEIEPVPVELPHFLTSSLPHFLVSSLPTGLKSQGQLN
jgi:hypothetical protein